jgi:beta-1,4-mannosyltransferase
LATPHPSSINSRDDLPVHVLFMPVPRAGNPYQQQLAAGLAQHGVTVRMARGYAQPLPLLQAALRGPRPDVLHLHWTQPYLYWPRSGRLSRLLAWRLLFQLRAVRRLGIRIVWTVHNVAAHERADTEAELRVSRRLAGLCDALVVHCEAARETVIDALRIDPARLDRVVIVAHGHYLDAYTSDVSRADARRSFGVGDEERVLLLFGALRSYKGATDLLAAFRRVDDGRARLLLAGAPFTSQLRTEIEAAAAHDERVITRLEFVPDAEVGRYMRAADAAVVPFRDVLTSGSVILAMSFGLAVIAPRLGCLPETVGEEGGILYDPTATDALARALEHALRADLRQMGEHNRAAIGQISWDTVADETIRRAYAAD